MEGKKSRIKNTTDLVVDRISSLPDFILGDILSFLPTKQAVGTSILSKRWKFAWVTVHNLDFYYNVKDSKAANNEDENMKFVRFVDRVLLLIDAGQLNKFSMVWEAWTIQSHVSSWINTAITRNVHELYLSLGAGEVLDIPVSGFNCDSLQSLELNENIYVSIAVDMVCLPRLENLKLDHVYFESEVVCEKLISGCPMLQSLYLDIYFMEDSDDEEMDAPVSVFTCDSLQSLELKGNINVPAAIVVCLPRLENLKLHSVHFGSEEACEQLISGCPVLHYLYLNSHFTNNGDDDNDYFTCIISSASLRRLEIDCGDRNRLKLKASSLEYLKLRGCISGIFVEKSLSSLVQANFDIRLAEHDFLGLDEHDFLNNSIVEAVRALDCAKFLYLSADVMRALSRATIILSTEFPRLVKLVAGTCCNSLQDLIQSSCNLEALTIYQNSCTSDPHDLSSWNALVEVPRCLSNSLKKVYLGRYNGSEDECDIICYLLKYGSVLEVMDINCYYKGDGEKVKLLQGICVLPRKSPVCKVQFQFLM